MTAYKVYGSLEYCTIIPKTVIISRHNLIGPFCLI